MNRSKQWMAVLIGLALLANALPTTGAECPNILLILSDDHAAHAASVREQFGAEPVAEPNC